MKEDKSFIKMVHVTHSLFCNHTLGLSLFSENIHFLSVIFTA